MSIVGKMMQRGIDISKEGSMTIRGNLYANNILPPRGNTWFVDSDNSVNGSGTTWAKAKTTIAAAVAVASARDIILVAPTINQMAGTTTNDYAEAVTIPATKMGLSIIGMGHDQEAVIWASPSQNSAPLTINARGCYVSGFRFRPNGSSTAGIVLVTNTALTANAEGTAIENCTFRSTTQDALAGIELQGGCNDIRIRHCIFDNVVAGIRQTNSDNSIAYRVTIEHNQINGNCTNGIILDCGRSKILNNMLAPGLTMVIQTNSGSATGTDNIVSGNTLNVSAYETNCSGAAGDSWLGNYCNDVASSVVGASAITYGYPQG